MTALYHDADGDLNALAERRIAMIGYGNLGRPLAFNLRDSGFHVLIGNMADEYATRARADGFEIAPIPEAARRSEIVLLMLPDEVMPEVYVQSVSPTLKPGDTLVFTSGYNVAFGYIEPPPFIDTVLIAPRTIGPGVREDYLAGRGYLSFVAVEQDATGAAWRTTLALAKAIGALRLGALELTFKQEAELDLFNQQAFLPALHNLLLTAADLLIKEGYPPEAALLDLYLSGELSYTLRKAAESGFMDTLRMYSPISQYGMLSRAERFTEPKLRRQMEITLEEIRGGKFSQEWAAEYANGYPRLNALLHKRGALALWALEHQAMHWLRSDSPTDDADSQANLLP